MTSYPPPPGPGPRVWEVPGRICPCLCSLCVRPSSAYFIILFIPLFTGFPHSAHHPFPYPSFSQTQQYSLCSSKYFSNSNPRAPPGDQRGSITGYPSWPELALLLHFLLGFPFSRPSPTPSWHSMHSYRYCKKRLKTYFFTNQVLGYWLSQAYRSHLHIS